MSELYCDMSPLLLPTYTELAEFRSTFIVNCIFNTFLMYTTIMLNIVTIYAMHKTSTMPKTLKTLLLSLACSDVAVGLFSQPLYTFFLVKLLQLKVPGCNVLLMLNTSSYLFAASSFLGVVAVSVDRFLALHFHLRYQELVTYNRVVIAVIGIWVYSASVSSMILWGLRSTHDLIVLVSVAFGFILTFVLYIRIHLTVQRHKNQIKPLLMRHEAQSDELKNFAVLIKSATSIFYVYFVFLTCYLPFFICVALFNIYGPNVVLKELLLFSWTLVFLNSSLNPVIYCWKMRQIRHATMDVLQKVSWRRNQPSRVNYNRSPSVVHVDN